MNLRLFALAFLLLLVGSVSASVNLTSGLVSYYSFDETSGTFVSDSTGFNNATATDEIIFTTEEPGILGTAADFTTDNHINTSQTFGQNRDPFTVSFWFKITEPVGVEQLMGWSDEGSFFAMQIRNDSATSNEARIRYFNRYRNNANLGTLGITELQTSTWYHYTVTGEGSTISLYLDGQLENTGTYADLQDDSGPFTIGLVPSSTYPNIIIDEFGRWSKALNSSQITSLYNSGSGLAYPFSEEPEPSSSFSITAKDAYDGSSLDDFSAHFNQSYYTATGWAGVSELPRDNDISTCTQETWAGFVKTFPEPVESLVLYLNGTSYVINKSDPPAGYDGSQYMIRRLADPMRVIVQYYNESGSTQIGSTTINSAEAYCDLLGFEEAYSTTEGTITADYDSNGTSVEYLIRASDYFPHFEEAIVGASNIDAELVQSYVSFDCREAFTNSSLLCSQSGPFPRKAGSYTDDVNVTGYYPVEYSYNVSPLDNVTLSVSGFYDHELTINASDYEGNPLTNFTLSVESTISSFNVTDNNTGTVVLPLLQGYLYNVTITQNVPEGEDRNNSIETQTFNITTSSESYQFNLSFPRLYIRVFDEQTNLILTDSTTTMTFQSGNSSFSLNTTNGLLNLTGEEAIQTGSYEVLFENPSYNPRTYSLTYNRTFPQSLDAYLVPLEAPSTIFTIEDRSTRNPIEGATVTIQRFVNGTLTTVLSLQSDITGRVGFDYIPNRRYEFTITKSGYETRSFNLDPILFSSYLILLDSNIVIGETGGDFSGVGITFTQSGFKESNQNNFSMSFSDSKGRLVRYGYNLSTTTTGQLTSQEGTNAYGSILPVTISIPDVPLQDRLVVDYYYERSDGTLLTYRTSYSITQVNPYSNQTWVGMRDTAAQIPILDRAAVVVIATGSLTALAFTFIGLSGAALAAMFILGFFALTGFINGWVIAVPLIGLAFILLGRGTQ